MTLGQYLEGKRHWARLEAVLVVGCQLLQIAQQLHEIGYTYNNLKQENIMINEGQVTLVGFRYASQIAHH